MLLKFGSTKEGTDSTGEHMIYIFSAYKELLLRTTKNKKHEQKQHKQTNKNPSKQ